MGVLGTLLCFASFLALASRAADAPKTCAAPAECQFMAMNFCDETVFPAQLCFQSSLTISMVLKAADFAGNAAWPAAWVQTQSKLAAQASQAGFTYTPNQPACEAIYKAITCSNALDAIPKIDVCAPASASSGGDRLVGSRLCYLTCVRAHQNGCGLPQLLAEAACDTLAKSNVVAGSTSTNCFSIPLPSNTPPPPPPPPQPSLHPIPSPSPISVSPGTEVLPSTDASTGGVDGSTTVGVTAEVTADASTKWTVIVIPILVVIILAALFVIVFMLYKRRMNRHNVEGGIPMPLPLADPEDDECDDPRELFPDMKIKTSLVPTEGYLAEEYRP